MMFAWNTVKIGEIATPVDRSEPPVSGVIYRQIGVRLWGVGAYERDSIDGADTKYKAFNKTETNDIIINKIWARNGSVSVVNEELSGCYCSGEFPLFKPDLAKINPKWFFWITKTRWFWNLCEHQSRGTSGKNRIKPEKFLEIEIPLPELELQEAIVEKLESLNAQINEVKENRLEISTKGHALLQSAFHSLVESAPYKQMSEVAPLVRRPVVVDENSEYAELGVRSFGKGTFHKPVLSGLEVGSKKLFYIHPDDLVFSNVFAWEGAIAVAKANDKGRVGSHRFITCVPKQGVSTSGFLSFYFLTNEGLEKIREASPGGAGRNKTLGLKKLEKIEVPVPSYEKQIWFNSLQKKMTEIQDAQRANETELEALMPSILDKAFKGELV